MASSVIITSRKLPRVVLRLSANSRLANNYGVRNLTATLYRNFSIELCNTHQFYIRKKIKGKIKSLNIYIIKSVIQWKNDWSQYFVI